MLVSGRNTTRSMTSGARTARCCGGSAGSERLLIRAWGAFRVAARRAPPPGRHADGLRQRLGVRAPGPPEPRAPAPPGREATPSDARTQLPAPAAHAVDERGKRPTPPGWARTRRLGVDAVRDRVLAGGPGAARLAHRFVRGPFVPVLPLPVDGSSRHGAGGEPSAATGTARSSTRAGTAQPSSNAGASSPAPTGSISPASRRCGRPASRPRSASAPAHTSSGSPRSTHTGTSCATRTPSA